MKPAHKIFAVVGLALSMVGWDAAAQAFPQRAMRMVVPFAPGGSTDTLARIIGQQIGRAHV